MKKEDCNKITLVTIFAIAMAFMEAVVVVYLRALYYPNGFNFPLRGFIESHVLLIEWVRELFTLVMLVCIGILVGKKFYDKLAYFMYSFAIWDIFYYVWLKVILDWPSSLFTWDILFLVPLPWIGPVLAPIIYSINMIIIALLIIHLQNKGYNFKKCLNNWILLILGSLIILYTFLYDYTKIIIKGNFLKDYFGLENNPEFQNIISHYIPINYNWSLFIIGEILIIISIYLFYAKNE